MKVSILQWNVWFKERADVIVDFIKKVDADVVCLQELTGDTHLNPGRDIPAEIARLGYQYVYEPVLEITEKPGAYGKMGNGIFSKLQIVDQKITYVQRQQPGASGPDQVNRAYVEVTLAPRHSPGRRLRHGKAPDTTDQKITIGTVHLSYTDAFMITEQKKQEVDRFLRAVSQPKQAYVLTGDFNYLPNSYTINKLSSFLRHAGPKYDEPTWTTKPFRHDNFEANTLDWRLDYVFTTPDVTVLSSKILPTKASDHLPILTVIEV